jgi:hypothetical protein
MESTATSEVAVSVTLFSRVEMMVVGIAVVYVISRVNVEASCMLIVVIVAVEALSV